MSNNLACKNRDKLQWWKKTTNVCSIIAAPEYRVRLIHTQKDPFRWYLNLHQSVNQMVNLIVLTFLAIIFFYINFQFYFVPLRLYITSLKILHGLHGFTLTNLKFRHLSAKNRYLFFHLKMNIQFQKSWHAIQNILEVG